MFGMIGKMRAAPGKRAELIAILSDSTEAMPGCLSYIVTEDASDPDGIWITEVWDNEASHKASLQLESVKAAITKARPIIAGFDMSVKTTPVSGI
ncbi:MAG: antibiotic biosynthesis monooxygenase [Sphingomonadales bacterium]|nr:MAG: antibiotic biosynthesis monooxygenase [Sphingomonadales bacterium]